MENNPTLHIGVMAEEVQLSDIVGVDILGNLSAESVREVSWLFPIPGLQELSTPMVFHYISSTLAPTCTTASLYFQPTVTYDNASRDFDILIIGGPKPGFSPAGADKFLKQQRSKVIMTTCVGSMWLASAGCLKGRTATTNRACLMMAKQLYPETKWLDQRWAVDKNLWTSGGAGSGIDMIAAYVKEKFPPILVELFVNDALDFDDKRRGQFYPDNKLGTAEPGDPQIHYWAKMVAPVGEQLLALKAQQLSRGFGSS